MTQGEESPGTVQQVGMTYVHLCPYLSSLAGANHKLNAIFAPNHLSIWPTSRLTTHQLNATIATLPQIAPPSIIRKKDETATTVTTRSTLNSHNPFWRSQGATFGPCHGFSMPADRHTCSQRHIYSTCEHTYIYNVYYMHSKKNTAWVTATVY